MTDRPTNRLSGALIERRGGDVDVDALIDACRLVLLSSTETRGWRRASYTSPVALRQEHLAGIAPPYTYPLLLRAHAARAVVLSVDEQVTRSFLRNSRTRESIGAFRWVQVHVDDLVKSLISAPGEYVLSFAHAKTPAFGSDLKSISFYGDDLTDAPLFIDQADRMTFVTCGLRLLRRRSEIVRVSNDGAISVEGDQGRALPLLMNVLAYLRNNGMTR